MNNLKLNLAIFLKFIYRYGMMHGIRLFTLTAVGNISKLRVPGISHPLCLRTGTSDLPAFYQIFLEKSYEGVKINDPEFIIDGGANIGLFAIEMKNKYPKSIIVCIEPDPNNFFALQQNIQHYDNVFAENAGLWNKDTKLRVYDKYNCGEWGFVVEEDTELGKIAAVSIETIMKKYGREKIDILKLDIETSEKQLFKENYKNWLPKTKLIAVELHDYLEQGCSKSFFSAVSHSWTNYNLTMSGENLVLENYAFIRPPETSEDLSKNC